MIDFTTLDSLCISIFDCPHSTPDWKSEGFPVIRNYNIKDGTIDINELSYVDENTYIERTKRAIPEENDIVISREAPMGKACIIPKNFKCCLGQRLVLLKVNKEICNPLYLLYALSSDFVQKQINRVDLTGSIVSNLNISALKELIIPVIPLSEQDKISECLASLDKKIQNNKKQIETLESLAKTIYDYWFVQFDFPNEDGKPYKSSGGKMVWNEELKREIPEGWILRTLNDLLLVSKDRIASNEIEDRVYVPIEAIPRNKMSFSETSDIDKAATGLCSFEEKAILFSNRRVYFHKVSISPFKGVTRDTVIIMYPKNKSNLGYAFQIVNSDHYIEYATKNSYGTEQPVLATPTALSYKYACPITGSDIIYSKKVAKIIDKVLEMEREIKVLTALRNFLIPLLVNGQVTLQ